MQRYIVLNEGHSPFLTDYYDPENHEPSEDIEQTVIDLATSMYRQNFGEKTGEWVDMEEDHL